MLASGNETEKKGKRKHEHGETQRNRFLALEKKYRANPHRQSEAPGQSKLQIHMVTRPSPLHPRSPALLSIPSLVSCAVASFSDCPQT